MASQLNLGVCYKQKGELPTACEAVLMESLVQARRADNECQVDLTAERKKAEKRVPEKPQSTPWWMWVLGGLAVVGASAAAGYGASRF